MASEEDVITLVVKSHDLASLKFRLRWEHRPEKMRRQKAERSAEVVEDDFREVVGGITVSWESLAFDPVADGKMEHRSAR